MTDQIETPTEEKAPRATRAAKTPAAPALPQSIIAIIPLIRHELGAIAKDQTATAGATFAYRGHDQIVNEIAPLFTKYGVFTTVSDESVSYGGRPAANNKWATASLIRKTVRFYGPDGTFVESTIVAESVDNGNKATSQAQTYAYRIALTQTFTIPTGDPDPDSSSGDFGVGTEAAAPVAKQPANAPAVDQDAVRALRAEIVEQFAARGIEDKDAVLAAGTKFFHGREGWDQNVIPLTKLRDALKAGEVIE